MIAQDRLERAAAFVAQLHRVSAKAPPSWRRAESVGRDVGLADAHLEQAIRDAEKAGLIERRADDEGLVLLTAKGRAAASQSKIRSAPMPTKKPLELHPLAAERQEKERTAVQDFVEGALACDGPKIATAVSCLYDNPSALRAAFRRIARESAVPIRTRKAFAGLWEQHGDHFRTEIGDDLLLVAGLRALMPPYRSGAFVIYRGDSVTNHKRRTYGASWSRSRSIADQHALHLAMYQPQGAVLLQATARREAIICALRHHTPGIEDEYIIDRRYLGPVTVLRRFPHRPRFHPSSDTAG